MIDSNYDALEIWSDLGTDRSGADVSLTPTADGFAVQVTGGMPEVRLVTIHWKQHTAGQGLRALGDHWERGYGDLEWRDQAFDRALPWYVLIYDPRQKTTTGLGVATGASCFASWRVDENRTSLVLDLTNGARGVRLRGRTLDAATIHVLKSIDGESAYNFACRFCRTLCKNPRLAEYPVYGGNDWYYAYGNSSSESIKRDATLIRELSPDRRNAPFMVIDAGWSPLKGCAGGPYDRGNELFPSMAGLAEWMTDNEVRPGIWIRPLLTSTAPQTCRLPSGHPISKLEANPVMDPSLPETLEIVRTDISRLVGWGYRLIKHDFTTYDLTGKWGFDMLSGAMSSGSWHFADPSRTTAEIIRDLYRVIREAAGDAVLIGCNTVGHLGAGLFELQRTGDDTSGVEWERTRKMGVNTLAFRMPQHKAFFESDADCVGLTNSVPWTKNARWLDLLAHSGTPLFVSAAPDAVGAKQRAALQEAFTLAATEQPAAEPLDWMESPLPTK